MIDVPRLAHQNAHPLRFRVNLLDLPQISPTWRPLQFARLTLPAQCSIFRGMSGRILHLRSPMRLRMRLTPTAPSFACSLSVGRAPSLIRCLGFLEVGYPPSFAIRLHLFRVGQRPDTCPRTSLLRVFLTQRSHLPKLTFWSPEVSNVASIPPREIPRALRMPTKPSLHSRSVGPPIFWI